MKMTFKDELNQMYTVSHDKIVKELADYILDGLKKRCLEAANRGNPTAIIRLEGKYDTAEVANAVVSFVKFEWKLNANAVVDTDRDDSYREITVSGWS